MYINIYIIIQYIQKYISALSGEEQFENFTQTLESSVFPQCEVRIWQKTFVNNQEVPQNGDKTVNNITNTNTITTIIITNYITNTNTITTILITNNINNTNTITTIIIINNITTIIITNTIITIISIISWAATWDTWCILLLALSTSRPASWFSSTSRSTSLQGFQSLSPDYHLHARHQHHPQYHQHHHQSGLLANPAVKIPNIATKNDSLTCVLIINHHKSHLFTRARARRHIKPKGSPTKKVEVILRRRFLLQPILSAAHLKTHLLSLQNYTMANPKAATPPAINGSSHLRGALDPGGKPLEAKNGKNGVNGGSKGEENGGHLPNGSCKNLVNINKQQKCHIIDDKKCPCPYSFSSFSYRIN